MLEETISGAPHPALNETGLWADAIGKGSAVINNNCNSIENGHPVVMRRLIFPLFHCDMVVAILGVANKPSKYDDEDITWVKMVTDMAWDIITKKLADEELEKLQDQLQHFQKMDAVGQLAGGIAHDFNNMLAVILGHTEMVLEHLEPIQPIYTNLEIIRKAASHSADLTRQLLVFSRKQKSRSKILTINSVVEEMLPILRRLVGENITLLWVAEARLLQVKIDPSHIEQILANLCINARDAITGIGMITIKTAMVHIDTVKGSSFPPYLATGNYAALTVSDNGCGIGKNELPHIFEPFFTTKEVGKGSGMGLSTVYGIVKQNNGAIECESKSGKGSLFRIVLPLFEESIVQTRNEQQPEPEKKSGTATILIVEDEPDILKLCQLMLESKGYNVLTALKTSEAISIAKRYDGPINLLLTDVIMPRMNGNTLSKKLQSMLPEMKTLFMSGYTADIAAQYKTTGDETNFIQKPFSAKTLLNAVQASLNP